MASTEVNPASCVSKSALTRWLVVIIVSQDMDFPPGQRGSHSDIQVNTGHHGHQHQCKQKQADPLALHPPGGLTNFLDDLCDIIHLVLSMYHAYRCI